MIRPIDANVSTMVDCLTIILSNPQPNVIHHEEKLRIFMLSNYRNKYISLYSAPKAKSFSNKYG
jgi:hypothetical protein